ncbi:MAG: DNA alkylation repair protein [Clostridiales bacterium]|jgi:3-methyladenine DNA glycosylase AlkD|nr:DNA alkylation repair protein [Clostridiales bacterium]
MDNAQLIRQRLIELSEEQYRAFSASLTPGKKNILGVRLPKLRKLAGEIVKEDWRTYLSQASDESMEEVLLQGMVIGKCKTDIEELLTLVARFIPKIDCWPVCDSFCSSLKMVHQYRERFWEFLQPYLLSDQEYEIRFGVVMLLNYYVLPEYAPAAFHHFDRIKHEGYYVKMAVAWAISIYFIKLQEETFAYLKNNKLDDFTYNKALQKITESLRVDKETKEIIRSMKRKNTLS